MGESDFPGVQGERRVRWVEGLLRAQSLTRQIAWIPADGQPEMPEVRPDLIGAAGDRTHFEQRCPVAAAFENSEFGPGGQARSTIDGAAAQFAGFGTNGRFANERIGD